MTPEQALDLAHARADQLIGFRKAQIAMMQWLVDQPGEYFSGRELGQAIGLLELPPPPTNPPAGNAGTSPEGTPKP